VARRELHILISDQIIEVRRAAIAANRDGYDIACRAGIEV